MSGTPISRNGQVFLAIADVMRRYIQPKEGEVVLLVADSDTDSIPVEALVAAVHTHKAEPVVLTMAPTFLHKRGEREAPEILWKALEEADVYIPLTSTVDCVHTMQVSEALFNTTRKKRIRGYALPEFCWPSVKMVPGGLSPIDFVIDRLRVPDSEWDKVEDQGQRFAQAINGHKEIRIASELGTDFVASIEGISFIVGTPFSREPGRFGTLGCAETTAGPIEGTAVGKIVIDGPVAGCCEGNPVLSQPITVTVKHGRVSDIRGGDEAKALRRMIDKEEDGDVIAEIAFGLNHWYRPNGLTSTNDKWILGVMHVAFGQNGIYIWPYPSSVKNTFHRDAVLLKASCWVDGLQVLRDGVPLV